MATSVLAGVVGDLLYPSCEPADPRVHPWKRGVTTAVTPGDDPR